MTYIEPIHSAYFTDFSETESQAEQWPRDYSFNPYNLPGFAKFGAKNRVARIARQEVAGRILHAYQTIGYWSGFRLEGFTKSIGEEYAKRWALVDVAFPHSLIAPGGGLGINAVQGTVALIEAFWELVRYGALTTKDTTSGNPMFWPDNWFHMLLREQAEAINRTA